MHLLPIHGFVLAGGRSSRMGRDKALLELGGKLLIEHATTKLARICERVSVLGSQPGLTAFGPLVPDVHPGCGPMGGIEAALGASFCDWVLLLPVDVPFVPTALLLSWARATVRHGVRLGTRLSMWKVEKRPQPALAMLHRDLLPFVQAALARGEFKLMPLLEEAARALREQEGAGEFAFDGRLAVTFWSAEAEFTTGPEEMPFGARAGWTAEPWRMLSPGQTGARALWFANLNTPEEFSEAERHLEALDT